MGEYIEVEIIDVNSKLLEINEKKSFLNKRNIKNSSGSE